MVLRSINMTDLSCFKPHTMFICELLANQYTNKPLTWHVGIDSSPVRKLQYFV